MHKAKCSHLPGPALHDLYIRQLVYFWTCVFADPMDTQIPPEYCVSDL